MAAVIHASMVVTPDGQHALTRQWNDGHKEARQRDGPVEAWIGAGEGPAQTRGAWHERADTAQAVDRLGQRVGDAADRVDAGLGPAFGVADREEEA